MATRHDEINRQTEPGYVPYHYASGRFHHYGTLTMPSARTPYRHASYNFSQLRTAWSGPPPQTVEGIIAQGYLAIPPSDPDFSLIADKHHVGWLGLDDAVRQIRLRKDIYQNHMEELTLSMCEANNAVHRQEADQGAPANERQRDAANKMIQDSYEQQRNERVNLWRDVTRIQATLPELVQSYLSSGRKRSILSEPGDPL